MQAGIYEHYKGGMYQCLGTAANEEGEKFVVYVSLTGINLPGPRMRVRPITEWYDQIRWPDGVTRQRFVYRGDEFNVARTLSEP